MMKGKLKFNMILLVHGMKVFLKKIIHCSNLHFMMKGKLMSLFVCPTVLSSQWSCISDLLVHWLSICMSNYWDWTYKSAYNFNEQIHSLGIAGRRHPAITKCVFYIEIA